MSQYSYKGSVGFDHGNPGLYSERNDYYNPGPKEKLGLWSRETNKTEIRGVSVK